VTTTTPPIVTTSTGGTLVSLGGGNYVDPTTGDVIASLGGGNYLNTATGGLLVSLDGSGSLISTGNGGYVNTATGGEIIPTGNGGYLNTATGTQIIPTGNGGYINTSTGGVIEPIGNGGYLNTATGTEVIPTGGGGYLNTSTGQITYSETTNTKDVNLQQSQIEQQSQNSRAQSLVSQFGMSFDKAVQVTALSDRMQMLQQSNGQMSADSQAQLLDSAYAVVGVSGDAVRAATVKIIQDHDPSAANALVEQAAKNLGMPSSAALRSQILPSLGIVLDQN
jgi:hypothetical protein